MSWEESAGRPLAPILKMTDGDELVCMVIQLKKIEGQYEGWLVDCQSFKGTDFALTGHQILVDKIREKQGIEPRIFAIKCAGQLGRAINYDVFAWTGPPEDFHKGDGIVEKIEATEQWLQKKLAEKAQPL